MVVGCVQVGLIGYVRIYHIPTKSEYSYASLSLRLPRFFELYSQQVRLRGSLWARGQRSKLASNNNTGALEPSLESPFCSRVITIATLILEFRTRCYSIINVCPSNPTFQLVISIRSYAEYSSISSYVENLLRNST